MQPHQKSPIAAPLWGHRRFYLEAQGGPISTMIYTSLQMIPILMSYKNSMPPKVPVVPHRSIHSSCFLIRGGISQESALSTALRQSQQGQRGTRSGNISNGEAFELVITNLSKIRGLGRSVVRRYLNYVGLSPSTRIRDLTNHQENRLYQDFDKWLTSCSFVIGNNHKEAKNDNLQKLRSIQTYRELCRLRVIGAHYASLCSVEMRLR